jgi:hypothetical protein
MSSEERQATRERLDEIGKIPSQQYYNPKYMHTFVPNLERAIDDALHYARALDAELTRVELERDKLNDELRWLQTKVHF